MSSARIPIVASLLALGAGAVWSLGGITAKVADGADPFQYLVWRSVAVIVVVEALSFLQRKPAPTLTAYRSGRTMIIANVMLFIASFGFVYAVKTTSPANAAFLGSTVPIFGALLAWVILRERLNWVTIVAIVVAFIGLLVTVVGDLGSGTMVGNLAALSSAVGFAGYTVCVRSDRDRDWSPVLPGYAVMMIVVCGAVTLAKGNPLVPPTGDLLLALLHGGVIIVLGTYMFNHASKQVPAAVMTLFAQTEMVLVPVWSITLLGERPKTMVLLGGCIIFVAILGKAVYDARTANQAPVTAPTLV
ncbi:MAG: DMT family transporter [Actinomycetota bacterium]